MNETEKLAVLIVGSGGREHAILQQCRLSPRVGRVLAAPGNGGMALEAECREIAAEDVRGMVDLARAEAVDFVIVGPEAALSAGLVDALEEAGIPAYGPRQAAARLESSKAFCKDFLARHGIPTAAYATFTEADAALAYLEDHPPPIVIKASGLAAGKGVLIAETPAEAGEAVNKILRENAFGESGREIVIEEMLYGEEASIHAIVSGGGYLLLPPSQDHKRIGDGDTGPNTGGMGAYAPTRLLDARLRRTIEETILRPTLDGLRKDGIDFRGTLYAGLMLTETGPRVLEYNVRFGDPETQAVFPLIEQDLVPVLLAAARGEGLPDQLAVRGESCAVVVLAADGYPGSYRKGDPITLPDTVPGGSAVYHAGTRLEADGTLRTAGGRVLAVSARAPSIGGAIDRAYALGDRIDFASKYCRRDIGHHELTRSGT